MSTAVKNWRKSDENTSHLANQEMPGLNLWNITGEYSIELKKDAKLVHLPARYVPETLHEPLKREQDRMVEMGVITPVHEATVWCHNLVYVIKQTNV